MSFICIRKDFMLGGWCLPVKRWSFVIGANNTPISNNNVDLWWCKRLNYVAPSPECEAGEREKNITLPKDTGVRCKMNETA